MIFILCMSQIWSIELPQSIEMSEQSRWHTFLPWSNSLWSIIIWWELDKCMLWISELHEILLQQDTTWVHTSQFASHIIRTCPLGKPPILYFEAIANWHHQIAASPGEQGLVKRHEKKIGNLHLCYQAGLWMVIKISCFPSIIDSRHLYPSCYVMQVLHATPLCTLSLAHAIGWILSGCLHWKLYELALTKVAL